MVPQAEVGSTASSYEILAKLATGGMAEIFLARHANAAGVERYVVLKRVLRERASDAAFVRMFLDEAKLAAQLQHPNIAQVYDIGKLGDSYFFTMEYVHGETVRALLHRSHALRKPMPLGTALTIAAGAAAGLHHAHERHGLDGKPLGIVHRDVSPSNLMVSYEGHVKLVDFGVAKAATASVETRSGTVKGKIAYLSPEQCRGRGVDRRSDLFSLGIVMWELLTVERLFKHPSDFETMAAIVNDPSPPPSSRRPDVPPELDALVLRLLAKNPDERFQTAEDVLEAIEQVAMQTHQALSTSGLGRFVRELFGQRPEPWVELRAAEQHPELVTVTSEPVPSDLGLELVPSMDVLQGVPLAPQPVVDASLPVPMAPTQTLMSAAPPPPPMAQSPFSTTPPSGSNPFSTSGTQPPPFGGTGSVSVHQPAPKKLPRLVLVLVPAALLGIVLGLVFGLSGKKKKPAPKPNDEGSAVAMVSIDAYVAPPADAAVPVDAPVPVDAEDIDAAVMIDAAVVEKHHHAAPPSDEPTLATCNTASVFAANPLSCTLLACRNKELAKAKKWLASVPAARRKDVLLACPALAGPDCKHEPMACQH